MKVLKFTRIIFLLGLGLAVAFFARWKLFLTPGVVGHNWDWNIPFLQLQNQQALQTFAYSWVETAFSYQSSPRISQIFIYLVGALTDGSIQSKFLLFFVPMTSLIGMAVLLRFLSRKFLDSDNDGGVLLGSLVYALSPAVFNDFIGGQLMYLVCYSLFPLWVYFLFKLFDGENFLRYLFPMEIIFFILSGSHYWFFAFLFIFVVYFIFFRNQYRKLLFVVIVSVLVTSSVSFYALFNFGNIASIVPESLKNDVFDVTIFQRTKQTIDKVFLQSGYGDRNLDINFLGPQVNQFYLLSYSILIFVLGNLFLRLKSLVNKRLFFWAVFIYLLALFLVTSGREPFRDFFIFLMQNVIYFRAFRTTFHFAGLLCLSYSALIVISLSLVKKRNRAIGLFISFVFLLSISPVFYFGDNGLERLKLQKRDSLDVHTVNPELLTILRGQFSDPSWYKVLYVPGTVSPVYRETPYQKQGQGADPEVVYSEKPVLNDFALTPATKKLYGPIEENVVGDQPINQKLLGFYSFREIVRRRDVRASFSLLAKKYDDEAIDSKLKNLATLSTSKYIDSYSLDKKYFVPHFYIPQNIVYSDTTAEHLPDLISLDENFPHNGYYLDQLDKSLGKQKIEEMSGGIFVEGKLGSRVEDWEIQLPTDPTGAWVNQAKEKKPFNDRLLGNLSIVKRLELHLANAVQRIVNMEQTGTVTDSTLDDYRQDMEEATSTLESIRTEKPGLFPDNLMKLEGTLLANRIYFDGTLITGHDKEKAIKTFQYLKEKIQNFRPDHSLSAGRLHYKLDIPRAGKYEVLVKDPLVDLNNWSLLGVKDYSAGPQELTLPEKPVTGGLITKGLSLKNYIPGLVYKVSFDYRQRSKLAQLVVSEDQEPTVTVNLPNTGPDFEHFEMLFKPSVVSRIVSLDLTAREDDNFKVEQIYQPEVLLKYQPTEKPTVVSDPPQITYTKINPTKYRVSVVGAVNPYLLIFSESFNLGWNLYLNPGAVKPTGSIVSSYFDGLVRELPPKDLFFGLDTLETWLKSPISEDKHFLVNGYANAWLISPQDAGSLKDYELIAEYRPQRLLYVELLISGLTLLFCAVLTIYCLTTKVNKDER